MKRVKKKEVVISHNVAPPTVLVITEWGYHLRFGNYSIPFGKDDAQRLIDILQKELAKPQF